MPTTRNVQYSADGTWARDDRGRALYLHTVTCGGCGNSRTSEPSPYRSPVTSEPRIHAWLRWLPGPARYHSRCRDCEREAGRARRRQTAPSRRIERTDRRFGIELELIMPRGMSRETVASELRSAGLTNWVVKSDGSLSGGNGMEIASPPISGEGAHDQIRTACQVLNRLGAKINHSCGLHVHHEIRDLSVDAIKRLARSWFNNQPMIDGLVSESRRTAREPYYCKPLGRREVERIEQMTSISNDGLPERYRSFNLRSYGRLGTVEIRQHQGTCNAEKISTWVALGQGLIEASMRQPIEAKSTVREFLAALPRLDETACTFLLGRALQFGAVAV